MITPPTDKQMLAYTRGHKNLVVYCGLVSFVPLVVGMLMFATGTLPATWLYVPFIAITVLYLTVSYLVGIFSPDWDKELYQRLCSSLRGYIAKHPPSVDIFLPICNEDKAIILNAWRHTAILRDAYPQATVYVLDDSKDDSMRAAAEDLGFKYLRRPELGLNKKAGNLKHGFFRSASEFILILDADFCPRPDMIAKMLPVMLSDTHIGIVQTPQYFDVDKSMNWIERGAGYIQELFYRVIQKSRNHWHGAICVGSCALYRRSAMLDIGGPVQISHSEDVWTGFRLSKEGYRVEYLPLNLAKGVCPDSMSSYFNQQYRWCSGSLSLGMSSEFWSSPLTVMQKVCYLTGFLYYTVTGLSTVMLPIPGLYMLWFAPDKIYWFNMFFYAPSFLFGTACIAWWSHYKVDFSYLLMRQSSYYAHLIALVDRLRGSVQGWIPTGIKGSSSSRFTLASRLAQSVSVFSLSAILAGTIYAHEQTGHILHLVPGLVFGVINATVGLLAFRKRSS